MVDTLNVANMLSFTLHQWSVHSQCNSILYMATMWTIWLCCHYM